MKALSEHTCKTVEMSKERPKPSAKRWQTHIEICRRFQIAAESLRSEANRLVKNRAKLPLKVRKKFDL